MSREFKGADFLSKIQLSKRRATTLNVPRMYPKAWFKDRFFSVI